jgi:hypothetical protein
MKWAEISLRLVAYFLNSRKTSQVTKKKFMDLVRATKDDGLITVHTFETFNDQFKEVMEVKSNGNS